jgi:hypothetical protein
MPVAEIIEGLPPYGPPATAFPPNDFAAYREGLVVRIADAGHEWVGNFQPGLSRFSAVEVLPNGKHVLVVSGGAGYIVDPATRSLMRELGGAIIGLLRYESANLLVVNHQGIAFEAIGSSGTVWKTARISWDGFRNVRVAADEIVGEAWRPFGQEWVPFSVNILNGQVEGGAEGPADSGFGPPIC